MGKITVDIFRKKKASGEKLTMLTSYDAPMTRIIDSSGIDAILVGDSVGMVLLGYESTIPVTMEEMLHHAGSVSRVVEHAFIIGDMPFMSYQTNDNDAVTNAGRFIKEAGCNAVKVEGGKEMLPRIKAIVDAGIPVMGHIGLTPQSVNKIGGYKVQGRDEESRRIILEDALSLQKSGCFAVILECVPAVLAEKISKKLSIPTIGIGAGPHCDGQVLVTHDIIGYSGNNSPKFVKKYADVNKIMAEAVKNFKSDIETGSFPAEEHSY